MNICLFSIKLPILVKICPTVIEIVYRHLINGLKSLPFPEARFLTRSMESTDVSIDAIVALAKQKQTIWFFSNEDLVLIKALRQEKGYHN